MDNGKMNQWIAKWYEKNTGRVRKLMHDLWLHPELSLKEYYACQAMIEFAKEEGFEQIEVHAAEDFNNPYAKPNCMIASWGNGRPIIGIVGELDALPELGQENCPHQAPLEGPGHGCGHNLMGGGAAGAAAALRYAMDKEGLPGTVRLIQTPAEEIGVGKAYLAKNGVFSDLDVALMWHPMSGDLDFSPVPQQVTFSVLFEFYGKAVHAAGKVWNGRSALDAVQLMNIGCEFLREHKQPDTWMHYAITNGGEAPNIVPAYASVKYMFRSVDDYAAAEDLFKRAIKCAKGAAIMTETKMEYHVLSSMPQFYYNLPLCKFMTESAKKVPALEYTEEEKETAREFYRNLHHKEPTENEVLFPTGLVPLHLDKRGPMNCTDAADMTYFCPTIHCQGLGQLMGLSGHSWGMTFCAGSSLGEKAGVYAYTTIAQAGYDMLKNPEVIETFWEEYRRMNIPSHKDWV